MASCLSGQHARVAIDPVRLLPEASLTPANQTADQLAKQTSVRPVGRLVGFRTPH